MPAAASERQGVQPTVEVTANDGARADVAVGEEVHFAAVVEAPPGTGTVVSAEWDFDGSGEFAVTASVLDGSCSFLRVTAAHTFTEPGTYFPALRVRTQRHSNTRKPHAAHREPRAGPGRRGVGVRVGRRAATRRGGQSPGAIAASKSRTIFPVVDRGDGAAVGVQVLRFPMNRRMAYDFVLYRYLKSINPLHSLSRSSMLPIDPSCSHTCEALHTGTTYALS